MKLIWLASFTDILYSDQHLKESLDIHSYLLQYMNETIFQYAIVNGLFPSWEGFWKWWGSHLVDKMGK